MLSFPTMNIFRMRLAMLEYDDDDENDWEDIPYESDIYDNVGLPGKCATSCIARTSACRPRGVSCAGYPSRK